MSAKVFELTDEELLWCKIQAQEREAATAAFRHTSLETWTGNSGLASNTTNYKGVVALCKELSWELTDTDTKGGLNGWHIYVGTSFSHRLCFVRNKQNVCAMAICTESAPNKVYLVGYATPELIAEHAFLNQNLRRPEWCISRDKLIPFTKETHAST